MCARVGHDHQPPPSFLCPCCCSEALYGQLLSKYLDDPANLFVISSDFCHWGQRFGYTFHNQAQVGEHRLMLAPLCVRCASAT